MDRLPDLRSNTFAFHQTVAVTRPPRHMSSSSPSPSSSQQPNARDSKRQPTSPLHFQRQLAASRHLRIDPNPPQAPRPHYANLEAVHGRAPSAPTTAATAVTHSTAAGATEALSSDISAYIGSGETSAAGNGTLSAGGRLDPGLLFGGIDGLLSLDVIRGPYSTGIDGSSAGDLGRQRQREIGEQTVGDLDLDLDNDDDSGADSAGGWRRRIDRGKGRAADSVSTSKDRVNMERRPGYHRSTGGRAGTPLLHKKGSDDAVSGAYGVGSRPGARPRSRQSSTTPGDDSDVDSDMEDSPRSKSARRPLTASISRMRSRSPSLMPPVAASVRTRYLFAAVFLVLSLVSFTIQTELAAIVQHERGWDKAYAMLYATHGSWTLLWPVEVLVLRIYKAGGVLALLRSKGSAEGSTVEPWRVFWRRHIALIRGTAEMVRTGSLDVANDGRGGLRYGKGTGSSLGSGMTPHGQPWRNIARTTALVTVSLTVAGLSWYVAVSMTSPGDLTAIYNCSAFFAYAFSVPLLGEKLRWDKGIAVAIAIAGVLVVAYGDGTPTTPVPPSGGAGAGVGDAGSSSASTAEPDPGTRFLGNLIIGVGSVLYGLYEVLYKRLACPPDGCSPGRGVVFANFFGSCIGAFTLLVLWIPIPILHWTGIEPFELPPDAGTAMLLGLSVAANAVFAGSFLVLISLTSPVLSSVAALLTIFIVAVVDWWITGIPVGPAALTGGALIVGAFALLAWATWREMLGNERERRRREEQEDEEAEEEREALVAGAAMGGRADV